MISTLYMTRRGSRTEEPETVRKKPVTPELIAGILRWLEQPAQREAGRDQRWLAEQINMDEGQLSRTLRGEYQNSKYVDKLLAVTGVNYGIVEGVDAEREAIMKALARLNPTEREMFVRLLEHPSLVHEILSLLSKITKPG